MLERRHRSRTAGPRAGRGHARPLRGAIAALGALAALALAPAEAADPRLWSHATRSHFNAEAGLRWARPMGDWIDARGRLHGEAAFVETSESLRSGPLELDVTPIVRLWLDGVYPNYGFFLRGLEGTATVTYHSLESKAADAAPELVIDTARGPQRLRASADTTLDPSTGKSLDGSARLKTNVTRAALVRFELPPRVAAADLRSATLRLTVFKRYGRAPLRVGAYLTAPGGPRQPSMPQPGIAVAHPDDRGIATHPAVIFASDFDRPGWRDGWSDVHGAVATVSEPGEDGFEPLAGSALRVSVLAGARTGLNTSYRFAAGGAQEPESIYLRYYLRLGESWRPAIGGKLPGISGDYGRAGWGGRKSNGSNGWSMRGLYVPPIAAGNVLAGLTPVGFYAYHAGMGSFWGDNWVWDHEQRGLLERNRWYCIEQHVRLNTPGQPDGVARAWVDGRLAFDRSDVLYRTSEALRIERIWMNVYHGGSLDAPSDLHLYIDNVVVAREYIGPMAREGEASERWWLEAR